MSNRVLSLPTIAASRKVTLHQEPKHTDARHPTLCLVLSSAIPALCGIALCLASERADAGVMTVSPSMSTSQINKTISSSDIGDTIVWTPGTYQHQWVGNGGEYYTFLGDRNYEFQDGVTIRSAAPESGSLIYKVVGSNINIRGTGTVRMENTYAVGIFGEDSPNANPITNIHVSGIISNAASLAFFSRHYNWSNIRHSTARTSPDITFSHMTLIGGDTGFLYNSRGIDTDAQTPYIAIEHCTADSLTSKLVTLPVRADVPMTPDGKWTLLDTQKYLINNTLINMPGLTNPTFYQYFNTPENTAQKDVTNPYINPAKNDFVTTDVKFMPGTYIPQHDSPLNLGDGQYIGACLPEGTARIVGVSFAVTPTSESHETFRTSDLWIEFAGDNMGIPTDNGWKVDMKYRVEYFLSDPDDPLFADQLLATTTNHITYLSHDKVTTMNPPDFYPQEFLVPAGEWEIYARITNYASDGLNLQIETDRGKYFDYTQFAQYDSAGYRVTGLPEPATLSLIVVGGWLLALRRRAWVKGK